MAEQTEREVLNHLIETCRDGERGFRHAANHVSDPAVKKLFLGIATERDEFATALLPHAQRLGGTNDTGGSVAAALHRGWMTLTDVVRHDDAAIVQEAEHGERAALGAYKEALDGALPPPSREVVEQQYSAIKRSHQRVDSLLKRSQGAPTAKPGQPRSPSS